VIGPQWPSDKRIRVFHNHKLCYRCKPAQVDWRAAMTMSPWAGCSSKVTRAASGRHDPEIRAARDPRDAQIPGFAKALAEGGPQ
jgi:hypothetical protein